MADNIQGKKITELDELSTLEESDLLIIESSSGTKKLLMKTLLSWIHQSYVSVKDEMIYMPQSFASYLDEEEMMIIPRQ